MSSWHPMDRPPALNLGDGISVVAPASSPDPAACEATLAAITKAGYHPKTYRNLCRPQDYLSGSDEDRIRELEAAFRDVETRMVLAVRGGYGSARIIDRVDMALLTERPKIVCGYSDITAVHAAVQKRCGMISFHGPNLVDGLGDDTPETQEERSAFFDLVSGRVGNGDLLCMRDAGQFETIAPGKSKGKLIGGNLAVLNSLIGTQDEPDFNQAILFIEDVGEEPYRVDRMLTQLRSSGLLGQLAGAVLGYFSNCGDDSDDIWRVLKEFFEPLNIPVLAGFPAGHQHPNRTLPLGALVELDADRFELTLRVSVVCS